MSVEPRVMVAQLEKHASHRSIRKNEGRRRMGGGGGLLDGPGQASVREPPYMGPCARVLTQVPNFSQILGLGALCELCGRSRLQALLPLPAGVRHLGLARSDRCGILERMNSPSDPVAVSFTQTLLAPWLGPYGGVPAFDGVLVEDFLPALEQVLPATLAEIEAIAQNPAAPTFENTLVALEQSGRAFDRFQTYFGVWSSSCNTEAFRQGGASGRSACFRVFVPGDSQRGIVSTHRRGARRPARVGALKSSVWCTLTTPSSCTRVLVCAQQKRLA